MDILILILRLLAGIVILIIGAGIGQHLDEEMGVIDVSQGWGLGVFTGILATVIVIL